MNAFATVLAQVGYDAVKYLLTGGSAPVNDKDIVIDLLVSIDKKLAAIDKKLVAIEEELPRVGH